MFRFFFIEILPKFSDFVNSDDASGNKTLQNVSDYNPFLIKKRFEVIKKQTFSCEKLRNSGD